MDRTDYFRDLAREGGATEELGSLDFGAYYLFLNTGLKDAPHVIIDMDSRGMWSYDVYPTKEEALAKWAVIEEDFEKRNEAEEEEHSDDPAPKDKDCNIPEHLRIPSMSCENQRDIYFEVEEDALDEGKSREGALKLVHDPKWMSDEVHDIALRYKLTPDQKKALLRFLMAFFETRGVSSTKKGNPGNPGNPNDPKVWYGINLADLLEIPLIETMGPLFLPPREEAYQIARGPNPTDMWVFWNIEKERAEGIDFILKTKLPRIKTQTLTTMPKAYKKREGHKEEHSNEWDDPAPGQLTIDEVTRQARLTSAKERLEGVEKKMSSWEGEAFMDGVVVRPDLALDPNIPCHGYEYGPGKYVVWKRGVVGTLSDSQEKTLCQKMDIKKDAKMTKRIQVFTGASRTCSDMPLPERLACMSKELKKHGQK